MFNGDDNHWMQKALTLAKEAYTHNEVPVGAVLVHQQTMIASALNQTKTLCDPTAHAEILVLREGAKQIGNHRLTECTLYVTLEPCPMCAGACVQARIKRLVYALDDDKSGSIKSHFQIANQKTLNHHIECVSGIGAEESLKLMQSFFNPKRK